ncbi:hypothetical protein B0T18DRAFT_234047 [Schizothecium vesticola]|uniref:Uncharacterized protein n=1 Tax=Schizothecium vesticola TaxID=314040 RepID=A0AA40BP11_9PEZI|nr:hypothetical protein B0T18DRAFT_234047 [Schizothecium vesticola]
MEMEMSRNGGIASPQSPSKSFCCFRPLSSLVNLFALGRKGTMPANLDSNAILSGPLFFSSHFIPSLVHSKERNTREKASQDVRSPPFSSHDIPSRRFGLRRRRQNWGARTPPQAHPTNEISSRFPRLQSGVAPRPLLLFSLKWEHDVMIRARPMRLQEQEDAQMRSNKCSHDDPQDDSQISETHFPTSFSSCLSSRQARKRRGEKRAADRPFRTAVSGLWRLHGQEGETKRSATSAARARVLWSGLLVWLCSGGCCVAHVLCRYAVKGTCVDGRCGWEGFSWLA